MRLPGRWQKNPRFTGFDQYLVNMAKGRIARLSWNATSPHFTSFVQFARVQVMPRAIRCANGIPSIVDMQTERSST